MKRFFCAVCAVLLSTSAANASINLGTYSFDANEFGNTLLESDGGSFSAGNWLNIANVNPGNPGYLTGANFDTGIANLNAGSATYTIGYSQAITNGAGDDMGIVAARYSADTFDVSVSLDGVNFSPTISFGPGTGVATGVFKNYFYGGGGPYAAQLYVSPVNLDVFGIASNASIVSVRISGNPQADLIRVAGFADGAIPEPGAIAIWSVFGLVGLSFRRRKVS